MSIREKKSNVQVEAQGCEKNHVVDFKVYYVFINDCLHCIAIFTPPLIF